MLDARCIYKQTPSPYCWSINGRRLVPWRQTRAAGRAQHGLAAPFVESIAAREETVSSGKRLQTISWFWEGLQLAASRRARSKIGAEQPSLKPQENAPLKESTQQQHKHQLQRKLQPRKLQQHIQRH